MKKIVIFLALASVVITASADLTSFRWNNPSPTALTDNLAVPFTIGQATLLTFISDDAVIDFDPLSPLSSTYGDDILVYDLVNTGPDIPGRLITDFMTETDAGNNYQGKYAYVVALDKEYATYSGLGSVALGTYYGIGNISVALVDPDAPSVPQDFNSGNIQTSLQTIPEPAVVALLGIFGGGLLVARRLFPGQS